MRILLSDRHYFEYLAGKGLEVTRTTNKLRKQRRQRRPRVRRTFYVSGEPLWGYDRLALLASGCGGVARQLATRTAADSIGTPQAKAVAAAPDMIFL